MISTSTLRRESTGNWVAFDKWGAPITVEIPSDTGPAALLVSEVTDALTEIDEADRLNESVDRSRVWAVDAIVLNTAVLDSLGDEPMTAEQLIENVRSAGFSWQISLTSAP